MKERDSENYLQDLQPLVIDWDLAPDTVEMHFQPMNLTGYEYPQQTATTQDDILKMSVQRSQSGVAG
jgi:hypothetical protein